MKKANSRKRIAICAKYTATCEGHDCQMCSHNRQLWDDDGNETYLCRQLRDYTPAEIRMMRLPD